METSKQKIEGQSTKDTEVAPVVQIVPEEEYIELFGTECKEETRQMKKRSYRRGISLKNSKLYYLSQALPSPKACDKRIMQNET